MTSVATGPSLFGHPSPSSCVHVYLCACMWVYADKRVCRPSGKVVVTNTVAHDDRKMSLWSPKISLVSVAPLLAEAMLRVEEGGSLQDLRVYDRDNVMERYQGQGHE